MSNQTESDIGTVTETLDALNRAGVKEVKTQRGNVEQLVRAAKHAGAVAVGQGGRRGEVAEALGEAVKKAVGG